MDPEYLPLLQWDLDTQAPAVWPGAYANYGAVSTEPCLKSSEPNVRRTFRDYAPADSLHRAVVP